PTPARQPLPARDPSPPLHSTRRLRTHRRLVTRPGHPRRAAAAPRPGGWPSSAEAPAMQRVELPGSDGSGPKNVVVLSPVPLLAGEPGRLLSIGDEELTRLMAVARGRLENQLSDLVFPLKTNAANERLAQHLWAHRGDLFTFLRQPGLDSTNWRAELAIRFGVILRKVWGGNRTWAGARAQAVLMSVWRTCWQQGRSALDFLSHLLRGTPVALALPP